ncbi:MAG TPA: hypothetical protein VE442_26310 [Jatrophihabitans sp.]|jgi:hypothetical protein|nr:hypothetical protein [Jatrophihabitans sp.]
MTKISATLLGAIAAMSWLGPMPIPPPDAAQLLSAESAAQPADGARERVVRRKSVWAGEPLPVG